MEDIKTFLILKIMKLNTMASLIVPILGCNS